MLAVNVKLAGGRGSLLNVNDLVFLQGFVYAVTNLLLLAVTFSTAQTPGEYILIPSYLYRDIYTRTLLTAVLY